MFSVASASKNVWRSMRFACNMTPCPLEWLPQEDSHLAVELESVNVNTPSSSAAKKEKRVWFPEDSAGEPHLKNPDDGCGGSKHKLANIHTYYGNKKDMRAADYSSTANLWREAQEHIIQGAQTSIVIWCDFQLKTDALKEPEYSLIGLLWRQLFRGAPRLEESSF